ncbi:polyvinylalcohol dehydrogenase [Babesia caballi]|uniref:Polyvinylalcohol dehydrogenase n=1 Tax=Babesia caballi TaxID=5871 RepID=A0AAV4LYG2_BABCB|nr:polyvinylalcohol dehydrogenase [Babesia caballi]
MTLGDGARITARGFESLIQFLFKLTHKIGVGKLCGGGDGGELVNIFEQKGNAFTRLRTKMICNIAMTNHESFEILTTATTVDIHILPPALTVKLLTFPIQVSQPVVIKRQAAEEDLGSFSGITTLKTTTPRRLSTVIRQLVT